MRIGAVIVTWNSAGHIEGCLESCVRHVIPMGGRVLVLDNASSDDTVARASRIQAVQVIANRANAGFAAAVNQGFRELNDCESVLILNPDARVEGGLDVLVAALREPAAGAAGGLLLDPSGSPQTGFCVRRFPSPAALTFEVLGLNRLWRTNPVNRRYRCLDLDLRQAADVEQPAGAFLVVSRTAWETVGGFDERFHPLWFEDVDFLRRLHLRNYRILFRPEARAVHAGGHSLASMSWNERQLYWYGNLLAYASRHFGLPGRWLVCVAVVLGSLPRAVTGIVQRGSVRPLGVYGKVLRLAAGFLRSGRSRPVGDPVQAGCANGVQTRI